MGLVIMYLLILGIIACFLLLFWILILSGRKTHEAWSQLSTRTGLIYYPKYNIFGIPSTGSCINGTYRGRKVSLARTRVEQSGGEEPGYKSGIRIWIEVKAPLFGELSLSRPSFVGSKGISLGDEEFDKRFLVRSEPAEFAGRVFASAFLRQRLIQGPTPKFEVSKPKVGLESWISQIRGVDYWQSVLDILCDVAEAIEHL